MKLSANTIEILKNFSTINQSVQFKKGTEISTLSNTRAVLAIATIEEKLMQDCCIYDLNKFLAKFNLYNKDCDIEFDTDRVNFVSANKKRSDYIKYCSAKVIIVPPDKKLTMPSPDYTFELSKEDLEWQRKSAGISGSPNFVFRSDGKKIKLISTDVADNSSDFSETVIADGDGRKFDIVIKGENFKMIEGSYTIDISGKGLCRFTNKNKPLEYFIAIESTKSSQE